MSTDPGSGPRPLDSSRPLQVGDILDLRAYERVRDDFRLAVMARKRLRRIPLGPIMTVTFENVDTVRFQVQEMARVERILSDEGIAGELEVYNRLLPTAGELSATLFIELTSEEELRRWLPLLVGVETALAIEPSGVPAAPSVPEVTHAAGLSRETVTPAVHYLRFPCSAEQVQAFEVGPAFLAVRHPEYSHRTELSAETRAELVGDLTGTGVGLSIG